MGRVTRLCLWLTVGVLLSSCILQGPTFSHAEEVATATPVSPSEVDLALEKAGEKFQFQAEVSRLMDIIINSLYKSKEIFLRELISNASDALDKIRFLAIGKEDELLGDNKELKIEIKGDKEAKVLTIRDTGVGMTRQDLITNLGTVAKSGTASFIEKLTEGADLSLIGQFGVGFYSIYLVADKVRVVTKNNDDDQYVWESSADGVFTIAKDPRGNTLGRGTEITLFLKEESGEFAIQERLEELILRYSEFITFPIYLEKTKTEMMPTQEEIDEMMSDDEDEEGAEEEEAVADKAEEAEAEEGEKKKEEPVTVTEWERVNNQVAIWSRSPKDITDDEYGAFYKTISKDYQAPQTWIHFKAEGEMEFKSILFVPSEPAFDLYDTYYTKFAQLRLYVKKVLISDDFEELLPRYMNFIKGVVDSDDLPLNVSRETLQQHKLLKVMGKKLTRKALEMLRRLASNKGPEDKDDDNDEDTKDTPEGEDNEKYLKFWEQFGKSIKLGVIEDPANRSKLVKLLRFKTSKSEGKWVSLDHYIEKSKDWQTSIYYIAGESMESVKKSPFLEKFIKKDIEVVYLIDAIDEYAIQNVPEYEGRKLQSITKEGLKFGDEDEKTVKSREKYYKEHFKPTVDFFKDLFKGKIKEVQISQRVESAPCVIVTGRYGHSANMERIMRNQAMQDPTKLSMLMSQKTMEINPRHPMIAEINRRLQDDDAHAEKELKDTAWLLYDTALLESGFQHDDVQNFTKRVLKALKAGMGLKSMELLDEADIPEEEEEDAMDIEDDEDEDGPGATYTPPGGAPFGGKAAPDLNVNFGSDEL